jgi:hypothetical protein
LLKNENIRFNNEKFSNKDIAKNTNLYDKYKLSSKNNFNKIVVEDKKKNIYTKKEINYISDNNKNSYANFYRKKGKVYLKNKGKIEENVMNQTLSEFIRQQENNTISGLDSRKQDYEVFEDSLDEDYIRGDKNHMDYVNAHKMLIELDKINEEKLTEESTISEENTKTDQDVDLNDVVLEDDLIVKKM